MNWEQVIITAVQSLHSIGGSFFDTLFLAFTFLAEDTFLMVAIFAIYWCINKRLGEYMILSLFSSIAVNGVIKDVVRRPRPFMDSSYTVRHLAVDNGFVDTISLEHSFSFPSGHSQCTGSVWGSLALWFRKRWLWVLSPLVILGVMTSRVYLGVHFPSDVIVGATLGIVASVACYYLYNKFYEHRLWLFIIAVALLLPAAFLDPSVDTAKTIGVGIGAVVGLIWEFSAIKFTTDKVTLRKGVLRFLLGGVLALALRFGLKVIFPESIFFEGLRYALIGVTATGLVPWLFVKLKI